MSRIYLRAAPFAEPSSSALAQKTTGRAVVQVLTAYAAPTGRRMVQDYCELESFDLFAASFRRFSEDNGATWSSPQPIFAPEPLPDGGVKRQGESALFLSEGTGSLHRFYNFHQKVQQRFGSPAWWHTALCVETSRDGGRTFAPAEVVSAARPFEYTPGTPWPEEPSPWVISFDRPLLRSDGTLLLPVQRARFLPGDEDGRLQWEAGLLFGQETSEGRLCWKEGGSISLPLSVSVRGIFEPAVAELPDGRLMMVCRGSNGARADLPAHKWLALSEDGGTRWTAPRPFTFDDGAPFYSPSSGSTLVRHRDGGLFWIGNLCHENALGNRPRHPLLFARVDEAAPALQRATLRTIDERRPGEPECLQLSNFRVYEDRETGEFVLFMARLEENGPRCLDAPAREYRFRP